MVGGEVVLKEVIGEEVVLLRRVVWGEVVIQRVVGREGVVLQREIGVRLSCE